jgi:hypothetical protein
MKTKPRLKFRSKVARNVNFAAREGTQAPEGLRAIATEPNKGADSLTGSQQRPTVVKKSPRPGSYPCQEGNGDRQMRKLPPLNRTPFTVLGSRGLPEVECPSGPLPDRLRILLSLLDGSERRHALSKRWRGQARQHAFERHSHSFAPIELDMMTSAFYAAVRELERLGQEVPEREIERRIVECAAQGVFGVPELKRAALRGLGMLPRR